MRRNGFVSILLMAICCGLLWHSMGKAQQTSNEFPTYYGSYRQFVMHWYQQFGLYFNLWPRASKRDYELWLSQRPGHHRAGVWITAPKFEECTAYAGYDKNGVPTDFDDPDAPSAWLIFTVSTKNRQYFIEIEDQPWVLISGSTAHWLPRNSNFIMRSNIGLVFEFSGSPIGVLLSLQQISTLFNSSGVTLTYNGRTVNFPHDDKSRHVVLDLIQCEQRLKSANESFGPWLHLDDRDNISEPPPE